MTTLNLSVDMDRVQSSVQAAIRPAVETALNGVDIQTAIINALTKPPPASKYDYMRLMTFGGRPQQTLVEQFVQEGIEEIAKQYVQREIAAQRGEIEEGFRKMMSGSANKLVRAFAKATEKALEEDWGFDFSVKVAHTKPDSDDGGSDE